MRAFSRLGPLTGVFPRAAVVRFHLGLLLLWTAQPAKASKQLRLAAAEAPSSPYAEAGTKTAFAPAWHWDQVKKI